MYVGLEHIDGEGNFLSPPEIGNGDVASTKFTFGPSDVLFGKLRPYLRKTARPSFSGVCSTDILPLSPGPHVDRDFLYHALRYQPFVDTVTARCSGANLPRISPSVLAEQTIPLPPLPEQRRIAAILDKADALRAKRREAIAKLDQLLQSVFLDMFGDGEVGRFPIVALDEAYWFQEGPGVRKWQFTDVGVKLLNVGNIQKDGTIDLSKTDRHVSIEEAQGKYRHFLVDEGDLVIASSGVSFDTDGLLRTRGGFIASAHLPLCMNTSTIRFKALKGKSSLRFLQAWINSTGFRKQITRLVTGSAQQNFGPSHLRQLSIPLPPLAEQNRFEYIADQVEEQKRSALRHMTQLDHLFSSLQLQAFAGTR